MARYEGLIHKTASMYVGIVEEEFDDVVQILRVKVWRALEAFDPARSKLPVDRYVFGCMRNQVMDLLKKKRHGTLFIEDVAPVGGAEHMSHGSSAPGMRDKFDQRYLSVDHETVFGGCEDVAPLIPSTLTERERQVVALLYLDYRQVEIAEMLDLKKGEMARMVSSVRVKMGDWRPQGQEQEQALAVAA